MVLHPKPCGLYLPNMNLHPMNLYNQSVENAGVAYVKGANKRNEFFKKLTNSNI